MDVSRQNKNVRNIPGFAQNTMKAKAANVLRDETEQLGSIKASFGMEVHFRRERRGENGKMVEDKQRHYFKEDQPHVFTKTNFKQTFEARFNEFVDRVLGEIDNWSERGSGWEVEEITIAYVKVAR